MKTASPSSPSSPALKALVFDFDYQKVSAVKLNSQLWKVVVNQQVIHDVVVAQQAGERQATKKTKTRSEVAGSGKKPWKQKGTGRARHGSKRSPLWRGGGVVFGPDNQENYLKKTNRKTYCKALCMILSDALLAKKLLFWKNDDLAKPSTKQVLEILTSFKISKKKVLFIVPEQYHNLVLSTNNLPKTKTILLKNINPFYLLDADKILIAEQLLPNLEARINYL